MYTIVVISLSLIHFILCVVNLIDLYTKSQRPRKGEWLFVILCFPLIGALIYHMTKRRKDPMWFR